MEALQQKINKEKQAAESSKQSLRAELKKRDDENKKKIAEVTKNHVLELENERRAHQVERNDWSKELDKLKRQVALTHLDQKPIEAKSKTTQEVDFASALSSFEPKDEDVR